MLAAIESESGDPERPAGRAHVLDKLGRANEARAIQHRLTEIEPDKPAHEVAFGHNLRAAGEVEAAIASYRKAATLDYEFGEAWWSLTSIKRKVLTDADVTEISKGIAVAIDVRNSAPPHFALARALPARRPHAAAFDNRKSRGAGKRGTVRLNLGGGR